MKKLIALMLALAMIFAFAACKSDKDTDSDTTTNASQDDANVDADAPQDGNDESTEADTPDGEESTAPAEDGSEAQTEGGNSSVTSSAKPNSSSSAAITAPVGGSKAEVINFFNKYASAMKSYTGKVTVKRVEGTTSKINSITGGSAIKSIAEPLLPNDYPQTSTKTFNGGKASDGETLSHFMPADSRSSYKVDVAGVKSASCTKQGSGWKVTFTLVRESGEGLTFVPKYHSACFDTLSLTPDDFSPFEPVSTTVNYECGTFTCVFNADGTIASINVSEPANVVCKLKKGIAIDADFTGTWQQQYTFTY